MFIHGVRVHRLHVHLRVLWNNDHSDYKISFDKNPFIASLLKNVTYTHLHVHLRVHPRVHLHVRLRDHLRNQGSIGLEQVFCRKSFHHSSLLIILTSVPTTSVSTASISTTSVAVLGLRISHNGSQQDDQNGQELNRMIKETWRHLTISLESSSDQDSSTNHCTSILTAKNFILSLLDGCWDNSETVLFFYG